MLKRKTDIDFSYKKDAVRVYYDIEALPSCFTVTFWNTKTKTATLWFMGDADYDKLVTTHELGQALADYLKDKRHRRILGVEPTDRLSVVVDRFHVGNDKDTNRLRRGLSRFFGCSPLPTDRLDTGTFCEYVGWNSYFYDLPMLCAVYLAAKPQREYHAIEPADIRGLSDLMIGFDAPMSKLGAYFEDELKARNAPFKVLAREFKETFNLAMWGDGHIDIAKMLRTTDENGEQAFPPGLKMQEARLGMDIIADDAVSRSDARFRLSKSELLDFVRYNLHDVAATCAEGNTRDVRDKIFVRDQVREMFPYTSARSIPIGQIGTFTPPERDITEAALTARALKGAEDVRMHDYDAVDYTFPVPDGDGGFKDVDLLDYVCETEEFVPDDIKTFFSYWRGKSNQTWNELYEAVHDQPLTKAQTANIPYYRRGGDGKLRPIDAYIRVSTGGAHGSVWAGLSELDESAIASWTRANAKISESDKVKHIPTLDLMGVIHADFTSYYPYLLSKMRAYIGDDGVDRYVEIYERRVRTKSWLADFPDKSKWGPAQWEASNQQLGLKLQLNAATGVSNTHSRYALLPLDNKILSMRLIGNLSIWVLAQRMVNAGGYVISTNTDGIYVANITLEVAQHVINDFERDYGILVDPETVARFINRDVSNRLELLPDGNGGWNVNDARGKLRSATKLVFDDTEHGHSLTYPLAVGNAVVRYMVEDEDWLQKPYDRVRMTSILEDIRGHSDTLAWVQIFSGTSVRRLMVNHERQQKVDRVVLTPDGMPLTSENFTSLSTDDLFKTIQAWGRNHDRSFKALGDEVGIIFDDDLSTLSVSRLRLVNRVGATSKRGRDELKPFSDLAKFATFSYESFKDKKSKMESLWGKKNWLDLAVAGDDGGLVALRSWNEGKLSGYPDGCRGILLNGAAELESFDLSNLDMDAYLRWAESILATWKIGARLKDDGVLEMLDLIEPEIRGHKRRTTKADIARGMVTELYDRLYERIGRDDG